MRQIQWAVKLLKQFLSEKKELTEVEDKEIQRMCWGHIDNRWVYAILSCWTRPLWSCTMARQLGAYWEALCVCHAFPEAVKVLAGRGVGVRTAARILAGPKRGDDLLREVFEAEKQYAKTRRFWKD